MPGVVSLVVSGSAVGSGMGDTGVGMGDAGAGMGETGTGMGTVLGGGMAAGAGADVGAVAKIELGCTPLGLSENNALRVCISLLAEIE